VTFTATVAVTPANSVAPSGTVTFDDGPTPLDTVPLAVDPGSGLDQAVLTTSALDAATHTINVFYSGDSNYNPSDNTTAPLSLTVSPAATTTGLTASVTSSEYGDDVTFTATVQTSSPYAPTGTVTFQDGADVLGTADLAVDSQSGLDQATFDLSDLAVGSHTINAYYGGDGNFATSDSTAASLAFVVDPADTSTTLLLSAASVLFGQAVTFTASVAALAPDAGTPTGMVTFEDGTSMLDTVPLDASTGLNQATWSSALLDAGLHSIVAVYQGDDNFGPSDSSGTYREVTVETAPTTIAADDAAVRFSTAGQSVTLSATVSCDTTSVNEGTVTFSLFNGSKVAVGVPVTSGTVSDGAAGVSYTLPASTPYGLYTIQAVYNPGPDFDGNSDGAHTLTVTMPPTFTSAAAAVFTVGSGNSFTVTTTSYPAATLSETGRLPTGVTLLDNGNGTATLSGKPAPTTGAFSIDLSATSNGIKVVQVFTLSVIDPPIITSGSAATFTVGTAGSFRVTTTPGIPAATTLTESGKLPAGVSFVNNLNGTATLGGSAHAGSGGVYNVTITAGNAGGASHKSFTLTVQEPAAITSPARTSFTEGRAGSFTVTARGFPTAAFTTPAGLPDWVTFTDNHNGTATISGTPGATGTIKITLGAWNHVGAKASQFFTLTVVQAPIISSGNNATFTVGKTGTFKVTTPAPATTLRESGKLPGGVTFVDNHNGTATLGGSPHAGSGGIYTFTIVAANSAGYQTTQVFTLTVRERASIVSAARTIFTVGRLGSFTIRTDGFPMVSFTTPVGLPKWATFTDNHNGTATISGTPATTGTLTFTLRAANALSTTSVTQKFTLTIDKAP